jgi:hypothetical protein
MTDKLKDQDSSAPAATEGKQKASSKTRAVGNVIINPPEKVDPQRGFQERFKAALSKHTVAIEEKTAMVLQAKASRADLPADVLEQVYKRGAKALPLNTELTREQYAMNRVNSFIAGGAAMQEDFDILPIYERMGMKGTGGAMRPHIKREKSVYNGRILYHIVDKAGHVKHTTSNELEAKKHLATKYNTYNEGTLSPMKRFEGTKSLVKTYKADTPGEKLKEAHEKKQAKGGFKPLMAKLTPQRGEGSFEMKVQEEILSELNKDTLYSYRSKADKQIAAKHRTLGPQIKAGDAAAANKTSAIIGKRMAGMDRAVTRLNKEETLSELSTDLLGRYKAKAGEAASAADKKGDYKTGNKRFSGIMKATRKQFDNDTKNEETLSELSVDTMQNYMVAGHKKYDQLRNKNDAASIAKKNKLAAGIKKAHAKRTGPAPKPAPDNKHMSMSSPSAYYASKKPGQYTGD